MAEFAKRIYIYILASIRTTLASSNNNTTLTCVMRGRGGTCQEKVFELVQLPRKFESCSQRP